MKKLFFLLLLSISLVSCKKDEIDIPNSMAQDLQLVIETEGVQALQRCCEGCDCGQTIGWGTDYSFPGDNFVRIQDNYYNLNRLTRYEIETITVSGNSEKRMILYFPENQRKRGSTIAKNPCHHAGWQRFLA